MKKLTGIFFMFDFDGTLSPIVKHPKDSILPLNIKKWLRQLLKKKNVKIAIITGRSLIDIKNRTKISGVFFAANHGLEISYNNNFLLCLGKKFKKHILSLSQKLDKELRQIPNVYIENKLLSASVHYRMVPKKYHKALERLVRSIAQPYLNKFNLQLSSGKKVFEIRPSNFWNKGMAVEWLLKKYGQGHIPVYVGDDITDEDAFKNLSKNGITVRIGNKSASHAKYFIKHISELQKIFC